MKIDQGSSGFRPVIITLETIEEVQIMKNLVGVTSSHSRWVNIGHSTAPDVCPFEDLYNNLYDTACEYAKS